MSSNSGVHVRNRHVVGQNGLAATRETHGAPGFGPSVEGVSYADSRDGEQTQVPDLAPNTIETGHFDLRAAAPQVNNNPLAPTTANVIIDEDGIHITDGALYLADYGGTSVLGPAGFDGSWVEFITNGVYNGGFNAGITSWTIEGTLGSGDAISTTTIVSSADSAADYLASLSAAIPYWIVSEYTPNTPATTDVSAWIVADSTNGRFLNIERATNGLGDAVSGAVMTFMQDVPVVEGVSYDLKYIVEATLGPNFADAAEVAVGRGWRDSTHAQITAASTLHNPQWNSLGSADGEWLVALGTAPPNAKYARLFFEFTLASDVNGYGAAMYFFGASVTPKVWSSTLSLGSWTILGVSGAHLFDTLGSSPNLGRMRIGGGLGVYIENLNEGAAGGVAALIGPGGIGFAATSTATIGPYLTQRATNAAQISAGSASPILYLRHVTNDASGLAIDASGDTSARLFLNVTSGNEGQLAFGPGSGSRDWQLTRTATNVAALGSGDRIEGQIVGRGIYKGTTQSIGTSSWTKVTTYTSSWMTGIEGSYVSDGCVAVGVAGYYLVQIGMRFVSMAASSRYGIGITWANASDPGSGTPAVRDTALWGTAGATNYYANASFVQQFAAGDRIAVQAWHDSGSNKNVDGVLLNVVLLGVL